jgi:hypothetical protein
MAEGMVEDGGSSEKLRLVDQPGRALPLQYLWTRFCTSFSAMGGRYPLSAISYQLSAVNFGGSLGVMTSAEVGPRGFQLRDGARDGLGASGLRKLEG